MGDDLVGVSIRFSFIRVSDWSHPQARLQSSTVGPLLRDVR
jgi:hypothetical protein